MAIVRRLNLSVQVNNFPGKGWFLHSLPPSFYDATSLTVLELHSLKLEPVFTVRFPSLKTLLLNSVGMEDQILHCILLGSPCLENLVLQYCRDLLDPRISSSSLKVLEIQGCSACQTLRVSCSALEYLSFVFGERQYDPVLQVLEAANLESVLYYGNGVTNHSMANFAACSKIRVLSLSEVSIRHDECLEDLVSGLHVLETLALRNCTMFRSHLRICSKQPNLVSFNLNNAKLLKISIEAPNLLEHSFITIQEHPFKKPKIDDNWYTSLIEFFSRFGCCKSLRLNC